MAPEAPGGDHRARGGSVLAGAAHRARPLGYFPLGRAGGCRTRMNRLRKRAVADERGAMSYEGIRIPEELDRAVQRAVGITSRRHGTLGELVKDVAAQRGARRPENLISEQPTRHEVM